MSENFLKHEELRNIIREELKIRRNILHRHPAIFATLATFAAVMMFKGFEEVIISIPLFENHPWLMIAAGMCILLLTGTMYKKLNS